MMMTALILERMYCRLGVYPTAFAAIVHIFYAKVRIFAEKRKLLFELYVNKDSICRIYPYYLIVRA